jgi:hypothetical protein
MILSIAGMAFAQTSSLSEPDPTIVGAESARQALEEVSVDLMEREGSWNSRISSDVGVISGRLFEGGPAAKEPLNDAGNQDLEDTHVYGAKVEFFHRGVNSFFITAARPIAIEGITKTVSVWVAGRNQNHTLTLLVQDYFGNNFELYMGTLAFSGWKKMTVAVPPSPDGKRGIIQTSAFFGDRPGLSIVGFRIDCDPETAFGTYYFYIDDIRAVTDLYTIKNRDADDMIDNW